MTPHAAAAIAMILIIFIILLVLVFRFELNKQKLTSFRFDAYQSIVKPMDCKRENRKYEKTVHLALLYRNQSNVIHLRQIPYK